MKKPAKSTFSFTAAVVLWALLAYVFLQLVAGLIEKTYAYGLLQTGIPTEVASILLLFTPVLMLRSRRTSRRFLQLTGSLGLLLWATSLTLNTRGKLVACGLGTGVFMLFLPSVVWLASRQRRPGAGLELAAGLALAELLSTLLRAANSGSDPTGTGSWWIFGWVLAAMGALLLNAWLSQPAALAGVPSARPHESRGRVAVLCVGLICAPLLLFLGFASPAVIARWSGGSYVGLVSLTTAVTVIWLFATVRFEAATNLSRRAVLVWGVCFTLLLTLAIFLYQVSLPTINSAYPLLEAAPGRLPGLMLGAALVLHPLIFFAAGATFQALIDEAPPLNRLAGGFLLAGLVLLVASPAHAFTTIYDYVPVVGPIFRDRFWLVYLVPGLGMTLPLTVVKTEALNLWPAREKPASAAAICGAILALAAILSVALSGANVTQPPAGKPLRVASYNLQQGYNRAGEKDFSGLLRDLAASDADVIGLQETDTARITGGNDDLVRFLADHLGTNAYYGPKTVNGTFGIALLSRYPIRNPRTYYMASTGEQTAAIVAEIEADGKVYHVIVTHLGNDGPIIQQQQVLQIASGLDNVIAMGDFNFNPSGEQYRLTIGRLEDAWQAAGEQNTDPLSFNLEERIDHIFISPGLQVRSAEYLDTGSSDHPLLVVEIPAAP